MGKVIMSGIVPQLTVPVMPVISASELAEGSIVKVNESGVPVEFYVAKHNYESSLNGTGRTLLVRKDCYQNGEWNTSESNYYGSCTMQSWFNDTYKAKLDSVVQTAISTTKFIWYQYSGASQTIFSHSVFALSVTELGLSDSFASIEGAALPIANTLKVAYMNGSACEQWTRTNFNINSRDAYYLTTSGAATSNYPTTLRGYRPCFTIPSTAVFDEETLILKGVA